MVFIAVFSHIIGFGENLVLQLFSNEIKRKNKCVSNQKRYSHRNSTVFRVRRRRRRPGPLLSLQPCLDGDRTSRRASVRGKELTRLTNTILLLGASSCPARTHNTRERVLPRSTYVHRKTKYIMRFRFVSCDLYYVPTDEYRVASPSS